MGKQTVNLEIVVREFVGICPVCLAWVCEIIGDASEEVLVRLVARESECVGECAYLWFEDERNIERFYDAYMQQRGEANDL